MTGPAAARTASTARPASAPGSGIDEQVVTTLRLLAADMVQAADSGHPGMPLGAAPMAWALWSRHLRFDPDDPQWPDRDRFVLSAGHGSALLYALLHVTGHDLPLAELERFRRLGSVTPGHPERGHTPGVETTTGPLGQGLAAAVGMALAERMLNARFGDDVVDHRTFVLAGDGCLMEGISQEAAALAGHLRLGRLVVLHDDNGITIDGPVGQAAGEDVRARFAATGWHTLAVEDGTDLDAVDAAITAALADPRPSLVCVRTVIGHGAPDVAGTPAAHGSPLGPDRIRAMRAHAGRPDRAFLVPDDVRAAGTAAGGRGRAAHRDWRVRTAGGFARHPEQAEEWRRTQAGEPPAALEQALAGVPTGDRVATRQAGARVLAAAGAAMPELVGGSADLAGSTGTAALPGTAVGPGRYDGSTVHFGIREHAMAAVLNGLAGHGGLRPFGSTFLVFSDYLRPALRLSALMRLPVVHVFTHDSVAVGEDGPTHQPVEQLESLRLVPGLAVLRPADDAETVDAWRAALARTDGPTVLVLSRQALPPLGPVAPGTVAAAGARPVGPAEPEPRVTVLATGSEVALAVEAAGTLAARGIRTRVLSVPWRERFAALPEADRRRLTGGPALLVAAEAGATIGWAGLVGSTGRVLGIDRFGLSGPGPEVARALGLTADRLVDLVLRELTEEDGDA